ncbi:TachyKinin Receptor family [Trichostrongylus colubriformis]|uniref:TachyKinin Receptor family n=1 Tax=Trichostrongylus colubriformis TaxID=6319 RepID=A0AAN8IQY9_TRICO
MEEFDVFLYCEPFPFQHPIYTQVIYAFLFSTTIFLALVGNFTVIWIVLRHRQMRTVTNCYLLNLAVADATISIFNTGFTWSYNFYYIWRLGWLYCRFNNMMGITPICASVFTMIVMSIDRYSAIVHPMRRRPGKRATVAVICLVWVFAVICGIPAFLTSKLELNYFYDGKTLFADTLCLSDDYPDGTSETSTLASLYNTFLITIQYVLPLFILSCAYYRVGMVLRKDKAVGDTIHAKSIAAKKKAAFMLALVVLIFMIVWLPYNAYFLLSSYLPLPENRKTGLYIYINIYWLGMSSTVFNPVIYYFMNKRFRVGFRHVFRWMPCIHENRAEYLSVFSCQKRPSYLPGRSFRMDLSSIA